MNKALSLLPLLAVLVLGGVFLQRDRALRAELERIAAQPRPEAMLVASPPALCPTPPSAPSPMPFAASSAPGADVAATNGQSAEKPEPIPAAATDRVALDDAQRILDSVVARGRLSPADVTSMGELLRKAGRSAEGDRLVQQLAVAINTGRIVPEDPRMILLP